jgi:hypothetical protein
MALFQYHQAVIALLWAMVGSGGKVLVLMDLTEQIVLRLGLFLLEEGEEVLHLTLETLEEAAAAGAQAQQVEPVLQIKVLLAILIGVLAAAQIYRIHPKVLVACP